MNACKTNKLRMAVNRRKPPPLEEKWAVINAMNEVISKIHVAETASWAAVEPSFSLILNVRLTKLVFG
jgi:hypothetical protein